MQPEDITAIILAAGQGSRLRQSTEDPKILLRLQGASLLERHIRALRAAGVRRVVFVVGYRKEMVVREARRLAHDFETAFIENDEYLVKGNGYSFFMGISRTSGRVLVFDGDVAYDPAILERFLAQESPSALLVGQGSVDDVECAKALADADGYVRMTVEKRPLEAEELERYRFVGESMGILLFGEDDRAALVGACRDFFAAEENLGLNWEIILNRFLPRRRVPYHFDASEGWIEIDTPEDLRRARELFA